MNVHHEGIKNTVQAFYATCVKWFVENVQIYGRKYNLWKLHPNNIPGTYHYLLKNCS